MGNALVRYQNRHGDPCMWESLGDNLYLGLGRFAGVLIVVGSPFDLKRSHIARGGYAQLRSDAQMEDRSAAQRRT